MAKYTIMLTAFLGALIALTLSSVFSRFNNARRINRMRMAIYIYLDTIARLKLDQFIEDCNRAIRNLENNGLSEEDAKKGYDEMPMLTSDIIKSFSPNDLLTLSYNPTTYTLMLDFYYVVDFLKKNMPRDIYNLFSDWTNDYLQRENISAGEDSFKHIRTCSAIGRERNDAIRSVKMKIATTNEVLQNLNIILLNLHGHGIKWVIKYFWKQ